MTVNHQVLIDSLPQGKLHAGHYRLASAELATPQADEVLVKTSAFAITAGTRAGLQGSASYAGAPTSGIVMNGTGVGEVVQSNHPDIDTGCHVVATTGWQEYSVPPAKAVTVLPADHDPIHSLGPLGVTGLTAYFGLL